MEDGAEEDGGCVAAGGYVRRCPCCEGPRGENGFRFWILEFGFLGGVQIGDYLRNGVGQDLPCGDGLVFFLGFEESGEEIARVGRDIGIGFVSSLCDSREAEAYDWVLADGLEALKNGVFGPEPVDPGDLRNLLIASLP